MRARQVLSRSAAPESIPPASRARADAMRMTLGARTKSVLMLKPCNAPIACDDGITIAKLLELDDAEERPRAALAGTPL